MMGVMGQLKIKRSISDMSALKNSPQQASSNLKKNNEPQNLQASSHVSTEKDQNNSK